MTATVLAVYDAGGDVLEVEWTADDPAAADKPVQVARGWVSHTQNYFPPDAYGEDGHRRADVEPRAMTEAELRAYAQQLADDQLASLAPARERKQLL